MNLTKSKKSSNVTINKIIENIAFYREDKVLTIAISDSILNQKDYGETLKEYAIKYGDKVQKDILYFKSMFSLRFMAWVKKNESGSSSG